jgi:signal transduction histidine kinase
MVTPNEAAILKETERERNPQEAALMLWLKVLITTRWTAILGVLIATLVAVYWANIGLQTIPVYIICIFMAAYNLLLLLQSQSLERRGQAVEKTIRVYGSIHIILDLATLTVLLHYTGGIENPFIFFFVLHMIGASIALERRVVFYLAGVAMFMVISLVGLEYFGIIPHTNLQGFAPDTLYRETSYILAILVVLASAIFIATYMATAIARELRRRQLQVVELRERLLYERTGQLEQATQAIVQLEEEKNRFLSFISIAAHDLKAPLTAIQGFLWVMLGGFAGEVSEKQRNMLERSTKRITELLNLISDLLDIPRIETGQILEEMKPLSLDEVIKKSLDDFRESAEQKGIRINLEIPENLSGIKGSATRLQQAFTNLVCNAIYYTEEGSVTIRVTEQPGQILTEITDTGIGIPAEELPKIFEDFFRASNVEARGTGLGLSITRRIIEAHRGRIWVESPVPGTDKGSCFSFTIPTTKKSKAKRRRKT